MIGLFARARAAIRLRKANAAFKAAYAANCIAEDRQDTRRMAETRAALRKARQDQLRAEVDVMLRKPERTA
jgi:hypothetical protein